MAEEEFVYYKRNVRYVVGGRMFLGDAMGFTLTNENLMVKVPKSRLREFKEANKRIIIEGLIIPADEPNVDWETDNAITDEEALELVKNIKELKARLPLITSFSTAQRLLEAAKEADRPQSVLKLIDAKVEELKEEEETFSNFEKDIKGVR